ncbi:HlyD family type I secretion periplasmic adaptor subunit [Altererythrobacter sp. SALINAS58]|uniref:HlyD family type I secretion periplasmic adaptor subunit n=1 Tax=Alteripontixanthobacter muriae TaxID=2705546 RepID=UPI0015750EB7|nr:HlyD family type I secretion periplasmic adaptor subunit [Alteripontixanthobacter muriae]
MVEVDGPRSTSGALSIGEDVASPAGKSMQLWPVWAAVSALLLIVLVAATMTQINGAVIIGGELVPASEVKRIAHPTGGVIEAIAVENGEKVEEGSVLLRLDTSVSSVSAELSERSVDRLLAQRARLQAQIAGAGAIALPKALLNRSDISAQQAVEAELRQFELDRSERVSVRRQLAERISQLNRQIESYGAQINALELQRELIQPELEGLRRLREKGYVTIAKLNEMERTAIGLDGSIGAIQADIAGTEARIAEAREQQVQVEQAARARAGEELNRVDALLNEQQIQSASASDRFDRSVIRAPFPGVVDQMAYNAIGDVVAPGEAILRIVPQEDQLIFEGVVRSDEIDELRVGQDARIRLSALNANTTPELPGTITFVSAESQRDQSTGMEFYRVRVQFARDNGSKLQLIPGMPAEAFVGTGERSIISYLTRPIREQLTRAFRD